MVPLKQKSSRTKQEAALPLSCLMKVSYNFSIVSPSWEMFVTEKSHVKKLTSTCMPGNFNKSYSQHKIHGKTFWVPSSEYQSVFVSSFHPAPGSLLPPSSSLRPPSKNFEQFLPTWAVAIHPLPPSKAAAGLGYTWHILLPHPFATAKALCFTASYTAHYQTASSASSWDFAQQAPGNTSQLILIATSL